MSVPFFGPLNIGRDQSISAKIQATYIFGPDHDPDGPTTPGGGDTRPAYGQMLPRWNTGGRQPGP